MYYNGFTRFHDDKCRVEKQLQEMTDQGRYMLDVPGNGTKPCFMDDLLSECKDGERTSELTVLIWTVA